jgi:hypothetical protein
LGSERKTARTGKGGGGCGCGSLANPIQLPPPTVGVWVANGSVGRLGGKLTSVLLVFPCASDYTKLICRNRTGIVGTVLVASNYFRKVIELRYGTVRTGLTVTQRFIVKKNSSKNIN